MVSRFVVCRTMCKLLILKIGISILSNGCQQLFYFKALEVTIVFMHRFRESSFYQARLTAGSAILKPIFAKKLLQLGDFALQQQ